MDHKSFIEEFGIQFLLNFGDFDPNDYTTVDWLKFGCASIINTLIMMTMVISLLGNTYARVQKNSLIADYKEMASYILEIESIFLWIGWKGQKQYFQFCYAYKDLELGQKEELIDKKLRIMKNKIQKFKEEFNYYEKDFKQKKQESCAEMKNIIRDVGIKYDEIISVNAEYNKKIIEKLKVISN